MKRLNKWCIALLTILLIYSFLHIAKVHADLTVTSVLPIFKGAYDLFVDNHASGGGGGDYTYFETGLSSREYYVYVEGNQSTSQYYESRYFFFEYAHPTSAVITKFEYEVYTDGYDNDSYHQIFIDIYNVTATSWSTDVYDSGHLSFENSTDYIAKELEVSVSVPTIWRVELLIHSYVNVALEYGYNALNIFRITTEYTVSETSQTAVSAGFGIISLAIALSALVLAAKKGSREKWQLE